MWMMSLTFPGAAAHGVLQHAVGMAEGPILRDVVAHHFEQLSFCTVHQAGARS